jgi:hypothetical protein
LRAGPRQYSHHTGASTGAGGYVAVAAGAARRLCAHPRRTRGWGATEKPPRPPVVAPDQTVTAAAASVPPCSCPRRLRPEP